MSLPFLQTFFQDISTLQLLAFCLLHTSSLLSCAADMCLRKNKVVLESKGGAEKGRRRARNIIRFRSVSV